MNIWNAGTATYDNGGIRARAASKDPVWVHGRTAARIWDDVHGPCHSRGPHGYPGPGFTICSYTEDQGYVTAGTIKIWVACPAISDYGVCGTRATAGEHACVCDPNTVRICVDVSGMYYHWKLWKMPGIWAKTWGHVSGQGHTVMGSYRLGCTVLSPWTMETSEIKLKLRATSVSMALPQLGIGLFWCLWFWLLSKAMQKTWVWIVTFGLWRSCSCHDHVDLSTLHNKQGHGEIQAWDAS